MSSGSFTGADTHRHSGEVLGPGFGITVLVYYKAVACSRNRESGVKLMEDALQWFNCPLYMYAQLQIRQRPTIGPKR